MSDYAGTLSSLPKLKENGFIYNKNMRDLWGSSHDNNELPSPTLKA